MEGADDGSSWYFTVPDIQSAIRPGSFVSPAIELAKWEAQLTFVSENAAILSPRVSPSHSAASSPRSLDSPSPANTPKEATKLQRSNTSPRFGTSVSSLDPPPRRGLSLLFKIGGEDAHESRDFGPGRARSRESLGKNLGGQDPGSSQSSPRSLSLVQKLRGTSRPNSLKMGAKESSVLTLEAHRTKLEEVARSLTELEPVTTKRKFIPFCLEELQRAGNELRTLQQSGDPDIDMEVQRLLCLREELSVAVMETQDLKSKVVVKREDSPEPDHAPNDVTGPQRFVMGSRSFAPATRAAEAPLGEVALSPGRFATLHDSDSLRKSRPALCSVVFEDDDVLITHPGASSAEDFISLTDGEDQQQLIIDGLQGALELEYDLDEAVVNPSPRPPPPPILLPPPPQKHHQLDPTKTTFSHHNKKLPKLPSKDH